MILVDTSIWIEYDRATGSPADRHLTALITQGSDHLAVTEPVVMEVVAGARNDQREIDLRRMLLAFPLLRFDAGIDFDGATRIYRASRRQGITPGGLVDCMIAAVAHRHRAKLLTLDAGLHRVAGAIGLELEPVPA